jgi:NADH dehydrogenase
MTFVLVGGGPTGVELAASMPQMVAVAAWQFSTHQSGGNRVLPSFAEPLSRKAVRRLERLAVKVIWSQGLDWYSLCALTDRRRPLPWGTRNELWR